jgi:hypothetical protein
VRLYNDPAEPRCFEAFAVHMHLAWLYVLHACFIRDGVDYRYWDATKKRRLVRIDGELKRWELQRSVEEHWPDGGPVSANLDFFIRLRNRFEHRQPVQTPRSCWLLRVTRTHSWSTTKRS